MDLLTIPTSRWSLTLIFNPAQKRERFIRGLIAILEKDPIDPEDYLALYRKYDSHPMDPGNFLPR
jgi:hypothetical protein